MATKQFRYNDDFIKSLVSLYYKGKTQTSLCQEYGVSRKIIGWQIAGYHNVDLTITAFHKAYKSAMPSLD